MKKTELFYFSKDDLMISVVYNKPEHTASYTCHRKMEARETALIETYIEMKILATTNPIILYFGESDILQKTWDEFHAIKKRKKKKNKVKEVPNKEVSSKEELIKKIHELYPNKEDLLNHLQSFLFDDIDNKKIVELKENADEGFCFDRIGDILRDRTEKHADDPKYRMEELEMYLAEYNKLSKSKITLNSLI